MLLPPSRQIAKPWSGSSTMRFTGAGDIAGHHGEAAAHAQDTRGNHCVQRRDVHLHDVSLGLRFPGGKCPEC
eukprot:4362332-Pyramimonas_sp.AAC.1